MLCVGLALVGQLCSPQTFSSLLSLTCCHTPFHFHTDAVIPGLHVIEGGQTSTGSIVRWLNSSIVGEAGFPGYESLNAAAAELPPGCEGLLCCDHFQVCLCRLIVYMCWVWIMFVCAARNLAWPLVQVHNCLRTASYWSSTNSLNDILLASAPCAMPCYAC